jgi:WD repeat-containing protein 76
MLILGRWIQKFKAVWRPSQSSDGQSVFVIGNMKRSVDIYSGKNGNHIISLHDDALTAIPSVNAFHPSLDMIISGNASGRMCVWKGSGSQQ